MKMVNDKLATKTIQEVTDSGLCTGCGTCLGVCPRLAISIGKDTKKAIYNFSIDSARCDACGLCYKICPGHEVDFNRLNSNIFDKPSDDIFIGNYINCYSGYSLNETIRYRSTSGGVVTSLLVCALEKGLVDGVLVTRMNKDNPLEPESFIARTREEIINACGSKYGPVPANIAIKEILARDGKYAVVGLPCHIHGLRKAQEQIKKLQERIVLQIALFCGAGKSFEQIEFILNKFEIKEDMIKEICCRTNGWPGNMKISLKTGNVIQFPFDYMGCFVTTRCTLCSDMFAELADISCGDAWLDEFKNDQIGTNLIVSRTQIGELLLKEALETAVIKLDEIAAQKVVLSNNIPAVFKKTVSARLGLFSFLGYKIPQYNQQLLEVGTKDYILAIVYYTKKYLHKNLVKALPSEVYQKLREIKRGVKGKLREANFIK